jgi:DNA-binding LacI/PurR family transcriptional regulator
MANMDAARIVFIILLSPWNLLRRKVDDFPERVKPPRLDIVVRRCQLCDCTMAVTLKDVAKRAGVSTSAVSRAYTPGASVSARTRERVEKAAVALGYSPNVLASSLTTGRTKLIGLISNNFRNPVFLQVFDQFTRGLQKRGLKPLIVNYTEDMTMESTVTMLRQYSVDGVIIASSTLPQGFAQAFRKAGIPVVHSFGRATRGEDVDVVGIDNQGCGRLAAQQLIARGYTRIAFLAGPETATTTQDRLKGFKQECAKHRDVEMSHSFAPSYSFDAGRAEMLRLLKQGHAEAYFCGDDVVAVGALTAICDHGLSVPGDVGLLGLNDMEMARWANVELTTIRQPIAEIIDASVDIVVSLMNDPARTAETRLFACTLVERSTLRPLLKP